MLTVDSVRRIAEEEIPKYCSVSDEPYAISVESLTLLGQSRLIAIHWDVVKAESDGRFRSRSTAVDISQSDEMVRYRIKAAFAYGPDLHGMYALPKIGVRDHPTEPPPEESDEV